MLVLRQDAEVQRRALVPLDGSTLLIIGEPVAVGSLFNDRAYVLGVRLSVAAHVAQAGHEFGAGWLAPLRCRANLVGSYVEKRSISAGQVVVAWVNMVSLHVRRYCSNLG